MLNYIYFGYQSTCICMYMYMYLPTYLPYEL